MQTARDARRYLDELSVGDRFTSGTITVDEEAIMEFAARFDPQPFHLDADAAGLSVFQGLVASGWHTAALTMRLLVDGGAPIAGGIVGTAVEITWPRAVRPRDTLEVESEVVDIAPSRSRPDRGTVTLRSQTRNQHGEVVQILTSRLLVQRRPEGHR